jgi:hypothetical protein
MSALVLNTPFAQAGSSLSTSSGARPAAKDRVLRVRAA